MLDDIKSLLELQDVDREIIILEKREQEIPKLIEQVKTELNNLNTKVDLAKKKLTDNQLQRKNYDMDLKNIEDGIKKHQNELNSVKSNEAYKALNLEIADKYKNKDEVETNILKNMDEAEAINKELEAATKDKQDQEGIINGKIQDLEKKLDELKQTKSGLELKKAPIAEKIPKNILDLYNKMRVRKGARVVVKITDSICEGCNMPVTQRKISELISNSGELVMCDNCNCILYIDDENRGSYK